MNFLLQIFLLAFLFAWQNVTALNGDTSALVVTKNALAFKKDEDRALQRFYRYINHDTLVFYRRAPSDMNISLIVPCESVDAFVYGFDESQLFIKLAVCPPGPNTDCSSLQNLQFQNIGSCAFRINRAAKACLTNLSTATRISLFQGLRTRVGGLDKPQEEAMFAQLDQTQFEAQTTFAEGFFSNGGAYDVGLALNKLLETGLGDADFEDFVRNKVQQENYALLRKIIQQCDFSETAQPFIEYVSAIFMKAPHFPTETEQMRVFDDNISYNIFLKPYLLGQSSEVLLDNQTELGGKFSLNYKERITMNGTGKLRLVERYETSFAVGTYYAANPNATSQNAFSGLTNYNLNLGGLGGDSLLFTQYSLDTVHFNRNQVDPFEPVIFVFTANHNQLGIEKGKLYVMPAVWGFCIEKVIEDHEKERLWRHVQNGASIAGGLLAAPFSGGVSLGVALTAVGVGTADEVILNIQDNQSLAEYQNSAFLYNSWEVFYQTLNVVDGLVNAPAAIKSLASLVKTTMKMKFVKASSKLLKVGFYKAALGVLKGGAGSLLSKLDNPLFSVLKGKINQLDNILKAQFLDDFAKASKDVLNKLQNDNLFDVWKNDIRSNDIDELKEIAKIPNLRTEYNLRVQELAQKKIQLEGQGKTKLEIAQQLSAERRQLTIDYKKITPDDFMEWIFKRNELEYVVTGTGDKWGMTWSGALKKQAERTGLSDILYATPQQLETIYENIANGASKTFGVDKMALGENMLAFFNGKVSATELESFKNILKKYRMNKN
jgi:hypothetical protein